MINILNYPKMDLKIDDGEFEKPITFKCSNCKCTLEVTNLFDITKESLHYYDYDTSYKPYFLNVVCPHCQVTNHLSTINVSRVEKWLKKRNTSVYDYSNYCEYKEWFQNQKFTTFSVDDLDSVNRVANKLFNLARLSIVFKYPDFNCKDSNVNNLIGLAQNAYIDKTICSVDDTVEWLIHTFPTETKETVNAKTETTNTNKDNGVKLEIQLTEKDKNVVTLTYPIPDDNLLSHVKSGFEDYSKVCMSFNAYMDEVIKMWIDAFSDVFEDNAEESDKTKIRMLMNKLSMPSKAAKLCVDCYNNSAVLLVSIAVVYNNGEVVHTLPDPDRPQHTVNLSTLFTFEWVDVEDE